jgi:hypothetical protein
MPKKSFQTTKKNQNSYNKKVVDGFTQLLNFFTEHHDLADIDVRQSLALCSKDIFSKIKILEKSIQETPQNSQASEKTGLVLELIRILDKEEFKKLNNMPLTNIPSLDGSESLKEGLLSVLKKNIFVTRSNFNNFKKMIESLNDYLAKIQKRASDADDQIKVERIKEEQQKVASIAQGLKIEDFLMPITLYNYRDQLIKELGFTLDGAESSLEQLLITNTKDNSKVEDVLRTMKDRDKHIEQILQSDIALEKDKDELIYQLIDFRNGWLKEKDRIGFFLLKLKEINNEKHSLKIAGDIKELEEYMAVVVRNIEIYKNIINTYNNHIIPINKLNKAFLEFMKENTEKLTKQYKKGRLSYQELLDTSYESFVLQKLIEDGIAYNTRKPDWIKCLLKIAQWSRFYSLTKQDQARITAITNNGICGNSFISKVKSLDQLSNKIVSHSLEQFMRALTGHVLKSEASFNGKGKRRAQLTSSLDVQATPRSMAGRSQVTSKQQASTSRLVSRASSLASTVAGKFNQAFSSTGRRTTSSDILYAKASPRFINNQDHIRDDSRRSPIKYYTIDDVQSLKTEHNLADLQEEEILNQNGLKEGLRDYINGLKKTAIEQQKSLNEESCLLPPDSNETPSIVVFSIDLPTPGKSTISRQQDMKTDPYGQDISGGIPPYPLPPVALLEDIQFEENYEDITSGSLTPSASTAATRIPPNMASMFVSTQSSSQSTPYGSFRKENQNHRTNIDVPTEPNRTPPIAQTGTLPVIENRNILPTLPLDNRRDSTKSFSETTGSTAGDVDFLSELLPKGIWDPNITENTNTSVGIPSQFSPGRISVIPPKEEASPSLLLKGKQKQIFHGGEQPTGDLERKTIKSDHDNGVQLLKKKESPREQPFHVKTDDGIEKSVQPQEPFAFSKPEIGKAGNPMHGHSQLQPPVPDRPRRLSAEGKNGIDAKSKTIPHIGIPENLQIRTDNHVQANLVPFSGLEPFSLGADQYFQRRLEKVGGKNFTPKLFRTQEQHTESTSTTTKQAISTLYQNREEQSRTFNWGIFKNYQEDFLNKINDSSQRPVVVSSKHLDKNMVYQDWVFSYNEAFPDQYKLIKQEPNVQQEKFIEVKFNRQNNKVLVSTQKDYLNDPEVITIMLEISRNAQRYANSDKEEVEVHGLQNNVKEDIEKFNRLTAFSAFLQKGIEDPGKQKNKKQKLFKLVNKN